MCVPGPVSIGLFAVRRITYAESPPAGFRSGPRIAVRVRFAGMEESPLPALFGPEQTVDPYPAYRELRERRPVCPVPLPNGLTKWFVTRYDDAREALRDKRLTKDPAPVRDALRDAGSAFFSESFDPLNDHMLNADDDVYLQRSTMRSRH